MNYTAHLLTHHFLHQGTLFAERAPARIQTLLGSCVAVCLYDTILNFGGINHYMLPVWTGDGLPTPKYGNIAIEKLFEQMTALGAEKRHLVAKVFGGADRFEEGSTYGIGRRNIEIAEDILSRMNIPIVGSNVGGKRGRKMIFQSNSGHVLMKYLNQPE